MNECCDRPGYQTLFNDRFARRIVRSYRKKGLNDTQLRMVSFLTERGIQNASVLEIGGEWVTSRSSCFAAGREWRQTWRSRPGTRPKRRRY